MLQEYNNWKMSVHKSVISDIGTFPNINTLLVGVLDTEKFENTDMDAITKVSFAHGVDFLLKSVPRDSVVLLDWILLMRSLHSDIKSLCTEAQTLMNSSQLNSISSMLLINSMYNSEAEELVTILLSDNSFILDCEEANRPPSRVENLRSVHQKKKSSTQEMLQAAASMVRNLFPKSNKIQVE